MNAKDRSSQRIAHQYHSIQIEFSAESCNRAHFKAQTGFHFELRPFYKARVGSWPSATRSAAYLLGQLDPALVHRVVMSCCRFEFGEGFSRVLKRISNNFGSLDAQLGGAKAGVSLLNTGFDGVVLALLNIGELLAGLWCGKST